MFYARHLEILNVESFQEELTEKISKIRESNRELENTLRKISNAPDRCVCACACVCVHACVRVNEVCACVYFLSLHLGVS